MTTIVLKKANQMAAKKIDISAAIFSNITEDTAREFIAHRENIKKPLTQGAFDRAMASAVKCERLGITAEDAVLMTIDKGWQGIVYEYVAAELARRFSAVSEVVISRNVSPQAICGTVPRSTREMSITENLTDRSWAE